MTDEQWEKIAHYIQGCATAHGASGNWRREKTKGRKRHIVVDVLGCLLSVVVHAANFHDTKGGISTARKAYERYPSIQKFCADAGYRDTFVSDTKEQLGLDVDISEKIKPHQWGKLPWRWVVERTLSWFNHS
ncbi:MAG: transposase [Oscillibacter sp.]|nr:transposase [Oscillibacter sp.]